MEGRFIDKCMRFFFIGAFFAIVAVGFMIAMPRYRDLQGLKARHEQLKARIAAKEAEIGQVRDKQNRFRTDREFVESLARENRRVFPGELVFVFDR